ncbi:DUF4214 domain-containing protein [Massilia sp. G4R7]|uniref:DUF4214 domain-containing protein n=1 Tax=Massilia phyllostachyos TaxID=2898585 RepID=A0ABS8PZM6_9BURK|nr:DUF4214 domain-containing protein [Massilia phyllostachyos]MCD2514794.1 DUF4214 domain-containing protein [Massilia phyllostachyos]
MNVRFFAAGLACAALLAGCGGDTPSAPAAQSAAPVRTLSVVPVTQQDHEAAVQRLYLAYFGRAADPDGLAFYTGVSQRLQLVADTGALYWRYGVDSGVRAVLDGMAQSREAGALYSSDHRATVAMMYRNLFNREPDPGGLAFWSDLLARGVFTRGQVPVALLSTASIDDLTVFDRKASLAAAFTRALDTPERAAHYSGDAAVAALRAVLGKVDANTSAAQEAALVQEALAAVAASPAASKVNAIVGARCVACHSATPTMPGFASAPRGIRFDTPEQIRADAYRIYVNVVQTQFMPYGNQTKMTQAERDIVRAWYEGGAL